MTARIILYAKTHTNETLYQHYCDKILLLSQIIFITRMTLSQDYQSQSNLTRMVTRLYITNDTRNQMPLMCMCKSCDSVLQSGYSLPIGHATQTENGSPWLASYSQSYYLQIKYYAEIVSSSNRTNNIYCNTAYQLAIYWCDFGVTSL